MPCYAIRGEGLTNLELLGMVWDQIMSYSAKLKLKIPYFFRVIDVFYMTPHFICHVMPLGGGGSDQPGTFKDGLGPNHDLFCKV